MREYSESVEKKYKEWNDKYIVPHGYEFQLKTMFELEEQFRETPKEDVKTKKDILEMIQHINGRMQRFDERKKTEYNINADGVIISCDINLKEIADKIYNIYKDLIKTKF